MWNRSRVAGVPDYAKIPFDNRTASRRNWTPNLGVFAVSAAGVLGAFPAWWTRYLDSDSAAHLAQIPFSPLFLELSGYGVNADQRHVNAADVLVRRGVDRDGSR